MTRYTSGGCARRLPALRAALVGLTMATLGSAHAEVALQTIALSAQNAPGTSVTFDRFLIPAISRGGHVAFSASVSGDGVDSSNRNGIWSYTDGTSATLIARSGITPAGSAGETFSGFDAPMINSLGQSAFTGYLEGGGVGIWKHSGDMLSSVAKRGDDAPGTDGAFSLFFHPAFNGSGRLAFRSSLTVSVGGVPTDVAGIWSSDEGDGLELRALEGAAAPDAGPNVVFGGVYALVPPVLNDSGHMAFYGYLAGNGVNHNNDEGIWLEKSTGLHLVVREGQPAPGTDSGVRFGGRGFSNNPTPAINSDGDIAFLGTLTGIGISSGNGQGIWSQSNGGPLRLVARAGNLAPGTDRKFQQFDDDPVINAQGHTAFWGYLTGTSSEDRSGLWSEGRGNGIELIARGGDPAPDTDAFFQAIYKASVSLNARGQSAFIGALTGPTVNATNDLGIWAEDLDGTLRKILREGDFIDVEEGPGVDLRQVASFYFRGGSGNGDGRRSGFNDRGQLVFSAVFTDDSQGVFISNLVVPEPRTFTLLLIRFCMVLQVSHRKRCSSTKRFASFI